jgi:hypothetical protein
VASGGARWDSLLDDKVERVMNSNSRRWISNFNHRAGCLGYNSGSEVGSGLVEEEDYPPVVGNAWAGTGDVYAIAKPYSYTAEEPAVITYRNRSVKA